VFHEGWELPSFEAFVLLESDRGRDALRNYFDRYVPMAIAAGSGFILESATWRAVADVLDAFLDRTTPLLAGTGVHVET
jgi:homocysteine S-methyltransferase